VFCAVGPQDLNTDNYETVSWSCPGIPNGQVRIIWQTVNTSPQGLSEDEYFINVPLGGYSTGQWEDAASDTSGLLGSPGVSGWTVEFECNLGMRFLVFHVLILETCWLNCLLFALIRGLVA
jgi:hypothetical protein